MSFDFGIIPHKRENENTTNIFIIRHTAMHERACGVQMFPGKSYALPGFCVCNKHFF